MMRIVFMALFIIALPAISFSGTQAISLQCVNGIVSPGDTMEEVANKCGTLSSRGYTEYSPMGGSAAYRERRTTIAETRWTYDIGSNNFVYFVEFSGGKVRYIENTEKYGSR